MVHDRLDSAAIRAVLSEIMDPGRGVDLVSAGMVGEIEIADGVVSVVLVVPAWRGRALLPIGKQAEMAITQLPSVRRARVILTDAKGTASARSESTARPEFESGPDEDENWADIDRVIAIASGKGGVGKSTTVANLAVALALDGHRVGVLDADIYGPSQPRMLGVRGRPRSIRQDVVVPLENYGVKMISMGLLVAEDTAVAWRGPMAESALAQMFDKVAWGRLDFLLVDLPPGTGDIAISLAQRTDLPAQAIIVCTPQDVALMDARRAIAMLRKSDTKLLGLIENMSYYQCTDCGKIDYLFGKDGGRREAERWDIPFLGALPLDGLLRECGDGGAPIVLAHPQSSQARTYRDIARRLAGEA